MYAKKIKYEIIISIHFDFVNQMIASLDINVYSYCVKQMKFVIDF